MHRAVEVVGYNAEEPWEACRVTSCRETPVPGPFQVLVRVLCRPVNPSDVLGLKGQYPGWRPNHFPSIPGLEGMGIISQVGENVSQVQVGQRVVPLSERPALTGQGLWQEYIVVPETHVVPIPDTISNEAASQFVVNPFTVIGMLRTLNPPKGEYILQTAAASILGRMFIQYAHHQGFKTINIVRCNEQIEELKALGADEVINSNEGDVVEKIRNITGGKLAYGAIDCVGGELTEIVVESVRDDGMVLIYGLLSSTNGVVGLPDLIFRGIKLHGFWLSTYIGQLPLNERMELMGHTISLLTEKVIDPLIGEKYTLDQVKDAVKKSLEMRRGGKVLLVSD